MCALCARVARDVLVTAGDMLGATDGGGVERWLDNNKLIHTTYSCTHMLATGGARGSFRGKFRRFELLRVRPTVRTRGANLGERDASRFLICVRRSTYGERNVEVCPGEEQADDEASELTWDHLGIRDEKTRMKHEGDAAAGGGTPCAGGGG